MSVPDIPDNLTKRMADNRAMFSHLDAHPLVIRCEEHVADWRHGSITSAELTANLTATGGEDAELMDVIRQRFAWAWQDASTADL